jgi:hypothetical protein
MLLEVLICLYLSALLLLSGLDAFAGWRDKRWFQRSVARYDRVAAETVIVTDMDPVESREYLSAIHEHARPKFGACPQLLDGGYVISKPFGPN